ncbi:MAG: hypothetical protein JSW20_11435 [Nitrospiraceae bacterium]|nr:MAG: hypothetical protein JSW20_11435 [Nitrospiraceae bacterium]
MKKPVLSLFKGFGIEIEYMIVQRTTLDVFPVSDEVMRSVTGTYANDYQRGNMGWSNEFVLHVMEIKNIRPASSLTGLPQLFLDEIARINKILEPLGGIMLPSGMHPWMDPAKETRLWPHRYRKIYNTYNRIFNCRRHGWANLQSLHLNISFNGDDEFERLHAATRLILPIIPALAASSPIAGGNVSGMHDTRLAYYRSNQSKVPSIAGRMIPEPVFTIAGYREHILDRMYRDIAAYDPDGTIQYEWLNSRGAIPRFERNAIEIRLIDAQECPASNIAIAGMIISVLQRCVSEQWKPLKDQKAWKVSPLLSILKETIKKGEHAVIDNTRYLAMFDFPEAKAKAGELWHHLAAKQYGNNILDSRSLRVIRFILDHGTLATRILASLPGNPSHTQIRNVYQKLCRCLERNELFTG